MNKFYSRELLSETPQRCCVPRRSLRRAIAPKAVKKKYIMITDNFDFSESNKKVHARSREWRYVSHTTKKIHIHIQWWDWEYAQVLLPCSCVLEFSFFLTNFYQPSKKTLHCTQHTGVWGGGNSWLWHELQAPAGGDHASSSCRMILNTQKNTCRSALVFVKRLFATEFFVQKTFWKPLSFRADSTEE